MTGRHWPECDRCGRSILLHIIDNDAARCASITGYPISETFSVEHVAELRLALGWPVEERDVFHLWPGDDDGDDYGGC